MFFGDDSPEALKMKTLINVAMLFLAVRIISSALGEGYFCGKELYAQANNKE